MSLLEVRRLSHRFADGRYGVREVTFTLDAGELVLLAGRNGSGKTVLMKHLNGLLRPTEGEVLLEGHSIYDDLLEARRTIGLVFQDPDNQIVGQTVRDDVAFGPQNLRLTAEEIERRATAAVETLGLSDLSDRPPHELSGGEKRRLVIADVLAMEPKLIILDEPFSGLDFPGVRQTLGEIRRLHRSGHTLIVITHEVEKILGLATRVMVMEGGRIVEDGPPGALLERLERHGVRRPAVDARGVTAVTWLHS